MNRTFHRWGLFALGWASLALGACSVADNLAADEMLVEVDNIVQLGGSGAERTIVYSERADVTAWYMRFWLCWPIRGPLGWMFGSRANEKLVAPIAHVRELLVELPDETGGDLLLCALTASRLAWLAEFDASVQTRVVAIDGMVQMLQQLELAAFVPPYATLGMPASAEQLAIARAGLQAGRPDVRAADAPAASLLPYREALRSVAARPLADAEARIRLVEELTQLFATEPDPETEAAVASALRAALVHMTEGVLLRIVDGRAADAVLVRLAAMEQIRRLGGPATVPLLLAAMATSPAAIGSGVPRFDADELVELRLIHYCGQLRGDALDTIVTLPGRTDWVGLSASEFLSTTILNEKNHYSKLRTPALVAFTWALSRPRLDPDVEWVKQWREAHQLTVPAGTR